MISDCYEPASRFLRELDAWRRVDEYDIERAQKRAALITEAIKLLSRDHGIQMRDNPDYSMSFINPEKYGEQPQMLEFRIDFAEDVDLQAPRDWTHCFGYWVRSYVLDFKRWPPDYRIDSFRRFARTFGAKTGIKVLYYLDEQDQLKANPEIFPRVAMEMVGWDAAMLVRRKTLDWDNPDNRSVHPETLTFQQVDAEWDRVQKLLLERYDNGKIIDPQ